MTCVQCEEEFTHRIGNIELCKGHMYAISRSIDNIEFFEKDREKGKKITV